jgi:uncharacterized protein YceK
MKILQNMYAVFGLLMLGGCGTAADESEPDQTEKASVQQEDWQESSQAAQSAAENGQQEEKKAARELGFEDAIVKRAVDGDTLELDDGRKIRLVGVNTPESTTKVIERDSEKEQAADRKAEIRQNEQESYKNCTELRKVYPNGVPSTHQANTSMHDRDKDDWACER